MGEQNVNGVTECGKSILKMVEKLERNNSVIVSNFNLMLGKNNFSDIEKSVILTCLDTLVLSQGSIIKILDESMSNREQSIGSEMEFWKYIRNKIEEFHNNNFIIKNRVKNSDYIRILENDQGTISHCLNSCINCQEVIVFYQRDAFNRNNSIEHVNCGDVASASNRTIPYDSASCNEKNLNVEKFSINKTQENSLVYDGMIMPQNSPIRSKVEDCYSARIKKRKYEFCNSDVENLVTCPKRTKEK